MRRPSRSPLLTLLCLSLPLQGCQTWARYDVPTEPAPSSAVAGGRRVRVSMRDGTELMMHGTRVVGDSIVGDGTFPDMQFSVEEQFGKVRERWEQWDQSLMLQQLGFA